MAKIKYKGGYKYQLAETVCVQTHIVDYTVETEYIQLDKNGLLTVRHGYCWDGATWFPDLKSIMRGSLFHDALYQLMRLKLISIDERKNADEMLEMLCVEDGMSVFVAASVYRAVRMFAADAAKPKNAKTIEVAP